MFGRKFLLLKKKIYELEEDPNGNQNECRALSKENNIENDSFSLNKQFSK